MLTAKVKKLTVEDRFWYWIKERYKIHVNKDIKGKPKPWTDDEVLQSYFFTNPYRENDKVTRWFKEYVREPLRNEPEVLMATIILRWFNRISTMEKLIEADLHLKWNEKRAIKLLQKIEGPVFTGAFMIKPGNGPPGSKVPMVCNCITQAWKQQYNLLAVCDTAEPSMQELWKALTKLRGLGGFMSYEIVCDLRYTYLLENAVDVCTWCNPGPGAIRGFKRILHGKITAGKIPNAEWEEGTQYLLKQSRKKLPRSMPKFEMREIEHSLCEFDKYERVLNGDPKRMKRRYDGSP